MNVSNQIDIIDKSWTDKHKKYIDNHLCYESDSTKKIPLSAIIGKILIAKDFNDFLIKKKNKYEDFKNVFYCSYIFKWILYQQRHIHPFEPFNQQKIIKDMIQIINKQKNKRRMQTNKIQKYFENYTQHYDLNTPDDLEPCMHLLRIPPLPSIKSLITDSSMSIDEYNDNKNNIQEIPSLEDIQQMQIMVKKLGIAKGLHITITKYGYPSHLSMYQDIIRIITSLNEREQNEYLNSLSTIKLRDIKSKIGSSGKCGRKVEMVQGICEKLKELKLNWYQNKRKFNNENDNLLLLAPQHKRRRLIIDSDNIDTITKMNVD